MLGAVLLAAAVAAPSPSPTPPKTIVNLRSSPLCSTLGSNVFHAIEGLRVNDKLIASSKPVLLQMGKEYAETNMAGGHFDLQQAQWGNTAGGIHETNPGLEFDAERVGQLIGELVHNLDIIDGMLKDPKRFPATAKSEDDTRALALKAQLQAVADQQRRNLNILNGMADTFSMQDLIAKGDGTLGAINSGGKVQVSHNDQDVSFQDVITGPERGRNGHATDPTLSQDPRVTQAANELSNNPMARFYLGISQNENAASQAESTLAATVISVVNSCKQ